MAWVVPVIQGVMAVGSMLSQQSGADAAGAAATAQKRAVRQQWRESYRSMTKEYQATLGTQTARYAASGVDVGVGSVSKTLAETRDEYQRSVKADAYLTQQRLAGANLQNKAVQYNQVGNYFSGVAQLSNNINQAGQAAGWWK